MTIERLRASLADRYTIERELGQGGMATVYLAQDLKHDRRVALKVLRPELAAVLGAERFVVEIKTTAALQHPHILPLFDSGTADGFLYYVMPYVQGETLRAKLDRETQFGIEEAVKITTAVADALDYAHRHGVIHRDIKPENILLHDGRPMVADFGIALALSAAAGGRMTETGLSLGTPHYMSPEQATAEKEITGRSDIYSLASVLYEMLAGQPPHLGGSAQQIIMKIIAEPVQPLTALRKSVPPNVSAAVARALEKLPADRFESAAKFAEALANPSFSGAVTEASRRVPFPQAARSQAGWGLAALLALALAWFVWGARRADTPSVTQFAIAIGTPSGDGRWDELDISPDGRRIVQAVVVGVDTSGIVVRDLASIESSVIPGVRGGNLTGFRFSPDGKWIAYNLGDQLFKVPVAGGSPVMLADYCGSPAWVDMRSIICRTTNWVLGRVSANGGSVETLTVPDTASGEIGHWAPDALPGGKAVIFTSYRRPASRIEAYDLSSGRHTVLVPEAVMARYSRSGHLLFVRNNALFAVRFDPGSLRTSGGPVPVLSDVDARPSDAFAAFAISRNGTLAAVRALQWQQSSRVVWVDRRGNELGAIAESGDYRNPAISPDGSKVALTVSVAGHRDLAIYDLRRKALIPMTRSTAAAFLPVWTPDSRTLLFTNETPSYDLYRVAIDGSSPPRPVVASVKDKYARSVSPDGRTLAYEERWSGETHLMLGPIDGGGPGVRFADSLAQAGRFSPDGRWLAVEAPGQQDGQQIYVRRADGTGARVQISTGGGVDPHWTRGGAEIAFRRGAAVYAVTFDARSGTASPETLLFPGPYPQTRGFDVTPDGSRFVMVRVDRRPEALPILVIMGFNRILKEKEER